MLLIFGILLFLLVLILDVDTDKNKTSINHAKEAAIRILLLIPAAICLVLFKYSFKSIPTTVFLQGSWYLFLFNGFLNKAKNQDWWFTGSLDADDSKTEKFLRKLTLTQRKIFVFGLVVISTLLYIFYD
jgi:hypothetical protein